MNGEPSITVVPPYSAGKSINSPLVAAAYKIGWWQYLERTPVIENVESL
jgi:hypothetical protein